MAYSRMLSAAAACVCCMFAACSQQAPGAGASSGQATSSSSAAAGNACQRKLITAEDVAALFTVPVATSKTIPGDPQSCEFSTAGFSSVTISVRPGHGMAAVGMYTSGKMGEFEQSVPLTGVGDAAVRSLLLNRVIARKGDLLCEITGPGNARGADDPAIHILGALCNRIFAAY